MGHAVDEVTGYPPLKKKGDCKSYVKKFARDCHQPLEHKVPRSLQVACKELSRIP